MFFLQGQTHGKGDIMAISKLKIKVATEGTSLATARIKLLGEETKEALRLSKKLRKSLKKLKGVF